MQSKSHEELQVNKSGFIVHTTKGWVGASPDGWAIDPSYVLPNVILEVKRPYSMAEKLLKTCARTKISILVL